MCLYSAIKYKDWTGIIFAPVLLAFSILYYNYSIYEVDVVIRQYQVRIGVLGIGLVIFLWRAITLITQRKDA